MKLSFSQRIFLVMLSVILLTAISVLFITIYQFRHITKEYHEDRLVRKEERILGMIDYELDQHPTEVNESDIQTVLENRILGISDVNDQKINIFTLKGVLLLSTEAESNQNKLTIPESVLNAMSLSHDRIDIPGEEQDDKTLISSYTYLYNINRVPVAIVHLPYISNNSFFLKEQNALLRRYITVMPIVLLLGALFSWIMAKQITRRLKSIGEKLKNTQVDGDNSPILYQENDEVQIIVDSYNEMLSKLKSQSRLLAKKEREEAWREMAKQVAHEVKNPLTPMKLMIQNFKHRFNPNEEGAKEKVDRLSETIENQIDVITSIAEAFSDFAKMPIRNDEEIDLIEETQVCLDLFKDEEISFESSHESIIYNFDKVYLSRILTNLIKNAFQSIPNNRTPEIKLEVVKTSKEVQFHITDNGEGIPDNQKEKIFEPKFTTKSSGMGLGLPMVKKIVEDYNGTIFFSSIINEGTTFIVSFPLN